MNLQPIEDALRAWVKGATGLGDAQVYFGNQDVAQPPALPFVTILVSGDMRALGAYDEVTRKQDLSKPNGSEITQTVSGQRDLLVTVQAFAENTVSYPIPTLPEVLPGTNGITAVELLTRVQTALGLESVRGALNAAGLAPYDMGSVRRVDAVIETGFEGRAILDTRMYAVDQQSEGVGYIAEVTGTGTVTLEDGVSTRSVPYQAGP